MWLGTIAEVRRKQKPKGIGTGGGAPPLGPFPTFAPLLFSWEADNPANTKTTIDQTFAPSDVDLANNKIVLPDLQFPAFISASSAGANPVQYKTTGTPAGGLTIDAWYYLSPAAGGGYEVYPVASGNDWMNLNGASADDTLLPAQNFAEKANRVVLTSQGSGAHRFVSDELVEVMPDILGGGFTHQARILGNNHQKMRVQTDGTKKYVLSQQLVRAPNECSASNSIYGLSPVQGGDKLLARQAVANKRCVMHSYVLRWQPTLPRSLAVSKFVPGDVSTGSGLLTYSKKGTITPSTSVPHGLATGYRVRASVDRGGTLPAGILGGTQDYWFRSVTANTGTLHNSLGEAQSGANPVIPTTTGAGGFSLIAPEIPVISDRQRFLTEHLDPGSSGGNVLTAGWNKIAANGGEKALIISSDFASSGAVGAVGRTIFPTILPAVIRCYFWFPTASLAPTRTDTGQPMASGWYWVIRVQTSSASSMIFDDGPAGYAAALAGVGLPFSSSPSRIQFVAASGTGQCLVRNGEPAFSIGGRVGTETLPISIAGVQAVVPANVDVVLTIVIDYNDPAASFVKHYIYLNGVKLAEYETNGAKGNTPAAINDGASAWSFLDSAASHVAAEIRSYAGCYGASTGAITEADLAPVHNWYKTKYGIA